nr:unnamed protein product [Callosobruchus chinensis]CAH7752959.1 unnamed protein product [Callosobruchus chinensis]CAH7763868.1 unnamed protein product [Callosobruchus chinensis]
MCQNNALVL